MSFCSGKKQYHGAHLSHSKTVRTLCWLRYNWASSLKASVFDCSGKVLFRLFWSEFTRQATNNVYQMPVWKSQFVKIKNYYSDNQADCPRLHRAFGFHTARYFNANFVFSNNCAVRGSRTRRSCAFPLRLFDQVSTDGTLKKKMTRE